MNDVNLLVRIVLFSTMDVVNQGRWIQLVRGNDVRMSTYFPTHKPASKHVAKSVYHINERPILRRAFPRMDSEAANMSRSAMHPTVQIGTVRRVVYFVQSVTCQRSWH